MTPDSSGRGAGRRRRRPLAVLAVLGGTLALALLPATAASAHDYLVSSSPSPGSTVSTALPRVSLNFDDVVLASVAGSTVLQVTGPGTSGRHFETACPTILNRTVSTPVALGASGTYTATWRIVSADGHPVTNSISFVYAPPAGTPVSAGTAAGPKCGAARAAAGSGASADVSPVLGIGVAIAGGVFVLALVVVTVIVVLRLRRAGPP